MKRIKASFTIEAAIIVPLSMFIIISFLYMAFYLHDRVVMGSVGADYILENAVSYSSSQTTIEQDTALMLETRLIIAGDVQVTLSGDDELTLSSSASFDMPMNFLEDIMGFSLNSMENEISISLLDSRNQLLKYKAVADGIEILTGD